MRTKEILVGTDGTETSHAAVQWAAREAQRRGLPLRIVHAFDWQWEAARYDAGAEHIDVARLLADAVVAAARDQARAVAPALQVELDPLIGKPAPLLLAAAAEEDAELLVVGNRGRGGFAGLLLGSVSRRVAAHASCPVVVVRADCPVLNARSPAKPERRRAEGPGPSGPPTLHPAPSTGLNRGSTSSPERTWQP